MRLAGMAEDLGFDILGMPEHHFADYSFCPDSISALSFLAARTSNIELLTAVIVLPWHDPVRVVERIIHLDHLSNGRVLFGIGRGLAPREYAVFKVDQNEARDRFDESAKLVLRALETGVVEGDGPFYPYDPIEIRPRPLKSFKGRVFGVSQSPSSAATVATVGACQTIFVASPLEDVMPNIIQHRKTWTEVHGGTAPPPLFCDYVVCTRDDEVARLAREQWYPKCWDLTQDHYGLRTVDFTQIKGYESHASRKDRVPYADTQIWGTPEKIIAAWERRLETVGDANSMWNFRFGGMPSEVAEASMRLFVAEVMPTLKRMGVAATVTS
jgi:alkanesulfonate monooxygenase SsuD/methylene tetrahydromethanopterin reductase-like flavin-dependent oxidoreductase (luciferase family)